MTFQVKGKSDICQYLVFEYEKKTMSNLVNGMITFSQLIIKGDIIVKILCALSISTFKLFNSEPHDITNLNT